MGKRDELKSHEREKKRMLGVVFVKLDFGGSHSFHIIYNNTIKNSYLNAENYSLEVL